MTNPVLAALAQARHRAAPTFARWCELSGATFCPASPATVAKFAGDCAGLGIERLWQAIQEISRLHVSLALADPTLCAAVTRAVSDVADIEPPISWPDHWKRKFGSQPYDWQVFIAGHELRRQQALRRAQNEAAAAKRKLAGYENGEATTSEGLQTHEESSAARS